MSHHIRGGSKIPKSYYHLFKPEEVESKYSLISFYKHQPFIPLTEFYHYQINKMSRKTVISYVKQIERFLEWLDAESSINPKVFWSDEPHKVRFKIELFLVQNMNCKIRSRDHYQVITLANKNSSSINHFLAAIKAYYRSMIYLRMYYHNNPLIDEKYELKKLIPKSQREGRPRLSKEAGTEEPYSKSFREQSDSYFKLSGQEWIPVTIADIDLPLKMYRAAEELNCGLRDIVIVRLLFETGARINEILELIFKDYNNRTSLYEMSTLNKGSYGKRIKYIRFSSDTLKLLKKYVREDRRLHSKNQNTFKNIEENEMLFLTRQGKPYNYNAFYYNWNKIVEHLGLKMNPHKARHWFVTNMMRCIYESTENKQEVELKKKELIQYMKWKDAKTIDAYEHFFNEARFRDMHIQMLDTMFHAEPLSILQKKTVEVDSFNIEDSWIAEFIEGMEN
ncbi:tyrosine-type recombinase/integrase [Paenibacillus bovis]|uniref:Tyr recombinase domain-containing protein n=1 Tax=Paenibacillus bovis TaxID=1616788 RepID=A0A172ZH99_9BACL|nr:site-specific integrase [Paenibacillus bovis]ANF97015.1 hypothetical protein AR543_14045 [Paenibacillus bovis]